ncbi:hypothetical protein [Mesorhizobium sp. M0139]
MAVFLGRVDIRNTGTLGRLDKLLRRIWKCPRSNGDIPCFILLEDEEFA